MVKGRFYKAEWWCSTNTKYIESLVTPVKIANQYKLNYVDCEILVGKAKGSVVAINVGMNSRVKHEYFTQEAMMLENAEFFI